MPVVALGDFAKSFGTHAGDISKECKELIAGKDFNYEIITGVNRDNVILEILKKIQADNQIIGARSRQEVWNDGWTENLKNFIKSKYDLNALVPKFIRQNQLVRFNQNYIKPSNPNFELDYFSVFRSWLFNKYFKQVNNVYEFGCGTGFNLVALAKIFPDKSLYGLDFVRASCELVNKISEAYQLKLKGCIFDMIDPDKNFKISAHSAIFTIGSIEQLAGKFENFLLYLLKQSPELCVHVEPTVELYDKNNLIDYLAIKFQQKRGYTQNFLPRLKELEKKGKIEILKIKRLFFGSLYMEGYNLMIWRPIK